MRSVYRNYLFLLIFLIFALANPIHAQTTSPQFQAVPSPPPGRNAKPVREISDAALLAELKRGGYTVYFRHTSTDFSRDDTKSRGDDDCANQRPLIDQGRDEARRIGDDIRKLGIPVGSVLASPRCRTVETAKLIFGRYQLAAEARGGTLESKPAERYAELRALLAKGPGKNTNTMIASHGNPFYALAGPPYLAEGEAAVIKPLGTDFEVIARMRKDGWSALMQRTP